MAARGCAPGGPGTPGQDGFSLVELVVAMSIFGILLAIFGVTIRSFTGSTIMSLQVSDQATQARTVYNLFDKQVRAASAINRPVLVGTNWYAEFRTDAVTPSTCTQWVLRTTTRQLAVRTWTTGVTAVSTPGSWRILASDVVNDPTQQPFMFTQGTPVSPMQQLSINLLYRRGVRPMTSSSSTFSAQNSGISAVTNPDANSDGVSDTQVCLDLPVARP